MQTQLPIFTDEITLINNIIGFQRKNGQVYYFHGQLPLFSHDENDIESFRFITSQIIINGNATQAEVIRAFGVPPISVKRAVKRLREMGSEGFFKKAYKGGIPHVLTKRVLEKAQALLEDGCSTSEISKKLKIKQNTIQKAIREEKLYKKKL